MKRHILERLASVVSTRFLDAAPQTPPPSRPYLVLRGVSGKFDYHMQGASGYRVTRLQIEIYADTPAAAETALNMVAAALSGYRSGSIKGVFLDSHPDPDRDGGDPNELSRRAIDAIVHHVAA